jgi:hypothetical protein
MTSWLKRNTEQTHYLVHSQVCAIGVQLKLGQSRCGERRALASRYACQVLGKTENQRITIFGCSVIWTKLVTTGLKPGPRCCQIALHDTVNSRMMVFAGDNANVSYSVTWVLSHANGL